jgi:hypothetical protein
MNQPRRPLKPVDFFVGLGLLYILLNLAFFAIFTLGYMLEARTVPKFAYLMPGIFAAHWVVQPIDQSCP